MKEFLVETLKSKFDSQTFQKFALEFFNDLVINIKELEVNPAFKDHIDGLRLIGQYEDPEGKKLHILEVRLKSDSKLERARAMQRNVIAKHLKDYWLDGALVAFYAPGSQSWRLSFVKIEYKFDKNGKTKEELTPPKRFSFLVGEDEPCHTAQKQLLPLIQETNSNPTLKQIEEAFSVERVTKEFFDRYKELFEMVIEELNRNRTFKNEAAKNHINTENFAKKLLGQIVFLYFLQKKGWLGVPAGKSWGEGDRCFLRHLFEDAKSKGKNFFNDYLEILFYDTLNNPRRNTTDPSFSKPFNCRIPFLNGGLFEPEYDWKNSFIYLDDSIFERILDVFDLYNFTVKEDEPLEKEVAVDPEMLGKVFENLLEENLRKGKGTYYTPREIVHYMCQESLINYLVTESKINEEKIRKLVTQDPVIDPDRDISKQIEQKSIVFTDKEVEILDKLLKDIKIVDPACGSGAFLVGMLQLIVHSRKRLTDYLALFNKPTENRNEYQLKKEAIQNCIYGVDIDPGAVEIAKLRLWLSLVVDYDLEEIEPLPNLDYKIMQGNSLLEEFEGIKFYEDENDLYKQLDKLKEYKEEIEAERNKKQREILDYYKNNGEQDKQLEREAIKLARESKNVQKNIIELQKRINGLAEDEKRRMQKEKLRNKKLKYFSESDDKQKSKLKQEISDLIDWFVKSVLEEEKSKISALRKIEEEKVKKLRSRKDRNNYLKQWSNEFLKEGKIDELLKRIHDPKMEKPFFLWKLNFMEVFEKKGGFDIVIGNPPYIQLQKNKGELAKLYQNIGFETFARTGDIYCLFYEKANELLNNGGYLVYITSNKWMRAGYGEKLRQYLAQNTTPKILIDLGPGVFESATVDTNILLFQKGRQKAKCTACSVKENLAKAQVSLKDYIEKNKIELDTNSFNSGAWVILSPIEQRIKEKIEKIGIPLKDWDIKINYGIKTGYNEAFIIDGKKKDELIAQDPKSAEIIKPILRGKDIGRYCAKFADKWLIAAHNGYKKENGEKIKAININDYPAVKKWLDLYWDKISARQDQGDTPYNLRDCAYWQEFEKEKIVWQRITCEPIFYLSSPGEYILDSMAFLSDFKRNEGKYFLAILNSKLVSYWVNKNVHQYGITGYRLSNQYVEAIPIPKISDSQQKPFIKLVDQILKITSQPDYDPNNPPAKQKQLEAEIDRLVYKLYGLSEEEIGNVENK